MSNTRAIIHEWLDLIGEDREAVLFALLEMDHEVIPDLIIEFQAAPNVQVRAFLVEVIWQHRQQSSVPFLAEALFYSHRLVWRQALDGLVTLASKKAITAMRAARGREFQNQRSAKEFQRALDEAIEQAEETFNGK